MNTNTVISTTAFIVLTLLWIGFLGALVFNREALKKVWHSFRNLSIVLQVLIALFTLPLVVGLWVWNTRWPAWLRSVVVVALAWVTIYTFFPKFPLIG